MRSWRHSDQNASDTASASDDQDGIRGRWITLSNKRRVFIDDEGRVVRGLPDLFRQVDVRDVSTLGRRVREIESGAVDCERSVQRRAPQTFRTAEDAVRALFKANPELLAFVESECARHCDEYRQWRRRNRRGPKPLPTYGDGRFDAIEVPLELDGKRAISSWLEAVYVCVPPSRRWEDFAPRLQYLADATGLSINLPAEAEQLAVQDDDADHCQAEADRRIEELIALARASRLPGAGPSPDTDDVPF